MVFDSWREISPDLSYALCTIFDVRSTLIFILSCLTLVYFSKRYNKKSIPSCGGWIPWLGCAIHFGKQPLEYIGKKRQELGPVYTLKVAGENLTFISEVEDFHHFFQSKDTSFQLAVQEPVQKLACVSEELFFQAHTRLHDKVKSQFAPTNIGEMVKTLTGQLNTQMNEHPAGEQDLLETVRRVMYKSILNTIWGDGNPLASTEASYEDFLEKFKIFDGDFELGVKLPSWLLPQWSSARAYFLDRMLATVNMMKGQSSKPKQSLIDALCDVLHGENVHGFAMLVMFASLANAIPASCWVLIYVLTDKKIYNKLMEELNQVLQDKPADDFELTEEDVQKMQYLRYCVYETLRLKCEGVIARRVVKKINIQGYEIPAGHMLMISPYWTHRDPRYFEDPEVFNPDRWEHLSLDMKAFVAFGGGRYMCPGRWFGMMSMQAFVAMFLHKFKCTAKSAAPKPSAKHVIGVQHPADQFLISCEKRTYM